MTHVMAQGIHLLALRRKFAEDQRIGDHVVDSVTGASISKGEETVRRAPTLGQQSCQVDLAYR